MERASFIGAIGAVLMLMSAIKMGGGNLAGFIDIAAGIIIGGGMTFSTLICFPLEEVLKIPRLLKIVFFTSRKSATDLVEMIVSLAESARREGVLSLEKRMESIRDPFLAAGIRMVTDGMTPDAVEAVLRLQMDAVAARHHIGRGVLAAMGRTSPVFGLVATLMGLVLMLSHMDPETIGERMSVALVGTFYGVVTANLFFLPFADKLSYFNGKELERMEIAVIGVLGIQSGENPRIIRMKLSMFLPPDEVTVEEEGR